MTLVTWKTLVNVTHEQFPFHVTSTLIKEVIPSDLPEDESRILASADKTHKSSSEGPAPSDRECNGLAALCSPESSSVVTAN